MKTSSDSLRVYRLTQSLAPEDPKYVRIGAHDGGIWAPEEPYEKRTLWLSQGGQKWKYEYPGLLPSTENASVRDSLPFRFRLGSTLWNHIHDSRGKPLLDAENGDSIMTLPADLELERELPINPLAPFIQKISERLPSTGTLQMLTPTSANLVERTNIFDFLAFGLGQPEQALKFYAAITTLHTVAGLQGSHVKAAKHRTAPFAFAVLEKITGPTRDRFRIEETATKPNKPGGTWSRIAVPQGVASYEARAYFSLLAIEEEEKDKFHYILTGYWHLPREDKVYGFGEDAVRYALNLLVATIMRPGDLLYTSDLLPITTINAQFGSWLEQQEGPEIIWKRRHHGNILLSPSFPTAPATTPFLPPPVSSPPILRPSFKPDKLLQVGMLPQPTSLSTRGPETPLEVTETNAARQRVALCPLPTLEPGKTIDDLFTEYVKNLGEAAKDNLRANPQTLRANFGQWLRSKQGEEKRNRNIIKHEQRKQTAPLRAIGTLQEAL